MRLVTVGLRQAAGSLRHGVLWPDGRFVDLAGAARRLDGSASMAALGDDPVGADLLGFLRSGQPALEAAQRIVDAVERDEARAIDAGVLVATDMFRLRAPLPRPNSLRDFLLVEGHIRNARGQAPPEEWYRLPVYYKGNVDAMFGPEDVIPWPRYTDRLDYEIEVCAVIGRQVRDATIASASDVIVGYTLFNDWSARDIQRREMSVGLGPALGKDFANAIGPWIATPDEFDPATARLSALVNGETWSSGDLSGMRFSFEELIEWISMEQTLQPGDLLGSGTIAGGSGVEQGRWLSPGDTVELAGDGLGVLRNVVGPRPLGPTVMEPAPNPDRRPATTDRTD